MSQQTITKLAYWFWKKSINTEGILKLNDYIEKNFDSYEEKSSKAKYSTKTAVVKLIQYKKIKKIIEPIILSCKNVGEEQFGYILNDVYDLHFCHFNSYKAAHKGQYTWHLDEDPSPYRDIKLTILINLSTDKYEGGKFYILQGKEIYVNELDEPGSVLIFKSNLLHRVSPVTKGDRKTLALFLTGPAFR